MSDSVRTITKYTISRLVGDIKEIITNPLEHQGIYYKHDEDDMLRGYAMIIGPQGTPYKGGYYFFKFLFPPNYPEQPPVVEYMTNDGTTRFNPNFYRNSKVCLSVLNTWAGDSWTGCQTISSILLHLCTTLNDNPLCNEPGVSKIHRDYAAYNEIIEYKNYEIALLSMLRQKGNIFPCFGHKFVDEMGEIYDKTNKSIMSNLEILVDKNPEIKQVTTTLYNMKATIDYKLLLSDFESYNNRIKN